MGEVKKQTIRNSVVQYFGIVLGYVSAVILFPKILEPDQFGLTRVIFALATLYVNIGSLGTFKIIVRFFPFFKTEDHKHNGFLLLGMGISFIGFLLATVIYFALEAPISAEYQENSALFLDHYALVVWASLLLLYANIMESYLVALKKTVLPYFLKNVFIRIVWIAEVLLYYFDLISFDLFILLYSLSYGVNMAIMFLYAMFTGRLKFSWNPGVYRKRLMKIVVTYGLFSILSGMSNILVNRIDLIMITFLIGLDQGGVYSIATYISSVIFVPSQAIGRISFPVVSEHWKRKKMAAIFDLYQKSSINQLLSGGFILLCIWCNIDHIMQVLPPKYDGAKWAVLILGLSLLYNMSTGINSVILVVSKYYKYDTVASMSLAILTIVTNILLIPEYGLNGAALATFISVFIYHTFKCIVILVKLKMQPWTMKTVYGAIILVAIYLIMTLIPDYFSHYLTNILVRCLVIAALFFPSIYALKLSEDINTEVNKVLKRLGM